MCEKECEDEGNETKREKQHNYQYICYKNENKNECMYWANYLPPDKSGIVSSLNRTFPCAR